MRPRLLAILSLCCFPLLLGCGKRGPEIVPVSGVVTLDDKPVQGAGVMFLPLTGGRPAEGTTDEVGKFTLTTEKPGDGAMEGDYEVAVIGVRTVGAIANPDGTSGDISRVRQEWFLPKKYAKRETSGLQQTVSKDMPPIDLKLSAR